jgi:hypothetical protein
MANVLKPSPFWILVVGIAEKEKKKNTELVKLVRVTRCP